MIRFTDRIEFLQNMATYSIDAADWQFAFYSYANILPICEAKAGEIAGLGFGHVITEEFFLFRTRFHPGINKQLRIIFDNELYEIKRIVKIYDNQGDRSGSRSACMQRALNIVAFKIGEIL